MDRISDSGSDDWGSTPHGRTKFHGPALSVRDFFIVLGEMVKKVFTVAVALGMAVCAVAQKKDFSYKFYGQIRADLFYNSRSNSESVDGLFYMYPKDHDYDAVGKDLNAHADGSLYTMYTRLGVDLTGPKLGGKITTSAKVELDFRGGGTNYYMVRLRQAYFQLGFKNSSLLVGQTWHPFYGDVAPEVMNLNMGAPYQPFSRAPQVAYRLTKGHWNLKATALWQSQYLSAGPKSNAVGETGSQKSQQFLKNGCVPEVAVNVDYRSRRVGGLTAGVGVDMTSLVPRTQSVSQRGATYKVSERITTVSAEAHLKYVGDNFSLAAKTVFGSNFTQASGVGGFGVSHRDDVTGEQTYTPIRVSSTWVNFVYGTKNRLRPGIFAGYLHNLGAKDDLLDASAIYGTGVNSGLGQLATVAAELTYNLPHWKFGVEYMYTNAHYGEFDKSATIAIGEHAVGNHRVVFAALFQF